MLYKKSMGLAINRAYNALSDTGGICADIHADSISCPAVPYSTSARLHRTRQEKNNLLPDNRDVLPLPRSYKAPV